MDVAIIFVLYNPSESDLLNVMHFSALYDGVIVDNSPSAHFFADAGTGVPARMVNRMGYLALGGNAGIAGAQNRGIEWLIEREERREKRGEGGRPEYIVFMDQDSRFSDDYPQRIACEHVAVSEGGIRLSAIGPTVVQKETGEAYKSAIHKEKVVNEHFVLKKHIISSGCCVHRSAFKSIGLLEVGLFIDFVDDEWCWRGNAKGFVCGITPQLTIAHKVGVREVHIGKHIVSISKPQRYYYQYRNYLWLVRRKYVPRQWKMAYGVKFAARFVYFPLFIKGGGKCWKHMARGIRDGLRK